MFTHLGGFSKGTEGSGATTITSDPEDTTGATLIIATTAAVPTPLDVFTDNKGNEYTFIGFLYLEPIQSVYICTNPTNVGPGHTWTFNPGNGNPSMSGLYFSGPVDDVDYFGVNFSQVLVVSQTLILDPIEPDADDSLFISVLNTYYTNLISSITAPFTPIAEESIGGGTGWGTGIAYYIQGVSAPLGATWDNSEVTVGGSLFTIKAGTPIPPPVVVTSGYVTSLSLGPPATLTQNTEYALPVHAGLIHSTAALEISLDRLTWTPLTNADTVGTKVAGGFIRCPGGNAVVTIKRFRGF